ncbi:patatin-like phospholipase family protein [Rubellimicrobium arenae]|uniref:patatin-like phospholipase family protein n=1 Tax=Rubellimicrobium arenae TaxID=2817372 RepID=UPI001B313FCE|nr:patatin-like phospholipase family protein [Rubellimicrobium arenae]
MSSIDQLAVTSDEAQTVADFRWRGGKLEQGIGLALSGGGYRAMLFHAGALLRLNELGLLSHVDRISSVSGGSIAAGHLALVWPQLSQDSSGRFERFFDAVVRPLYEFSRRSIDLMVLLRSLRPGTSAAQQLAGRYDAALFRGATLAALPDRPTFVFCATNLQTGALWRFTKAYCGDYVLGYVPPERRTFRLAEAVAASSAFPPVLSPMELRIDPADFRSWGEGPIKPYVSTNLAALRERVQLTDGGIYDNHGLEPIAKRYTTLLVSDGGAPFVRQPRVASDWVRQLRRILDLTDNQVRAQRRRDLIQRFQLGARALEEDRFTKEPPLPYERLGAYWGIDTTPPALSGSDTLAFDPSMPDRMAMIPTRLADQGVETSMRLVNWGYLVADHCIRRYWTAGRALVPTPPSWPYREVPLG